MKIYLIFKKYKKCLSIWRHISNIQNVLNHSMHSDDFFFFIRILKNICEISPSISAIPFHLRKVKLIYNQSINPAS